jgi:hypothetical protein
MGAAGCSPLPDVQSRTSFLGGAHGISTEFSYSTETPPPELFVGKYFNVTA